jgi:hypothetical protein
MKPLERPLVPVLADMEMTGIKVDRDTLRGMSNVFAQKLVQLEEEIQSIAGEKFNVGSPSNWARSCSTGWANPRWASRARPAPMAPAPTFWKTSPR